MTEKKSGSSRTNKTGKAKSPTVSSKTRKETPVKSRAVAAPAAEKSRTVAAPTAEKTVATTSTVAAPRERKVRIDAEALMRMIAELAYFRAEKRGFNGGDPVEDWLAAEREIKSRFVA